VVVILHIYINIENMALSKKKLDVTNKNYAQYDTMGKQYQLANQCMITKIHKKMKRLGLYHSFLRYFTLLAVAINLIREVKVCTNLERETKHLPHN
jgi:hypothetical protein